MRCSMIAVAVLAFSTAASAQVTGIVTNRSATVEDAYDGLSVNGQVDNSVAQYSFPNGSYAAFQAIENYQVSANVTTNAIDFANNATSQGFYSVASTTTSVTVTYRNDGSTTLRPSLRSSIVPGGFGFYMDNPLANPTLSGINVGDVNQTPQSSVGTFQNISGWSDAGPYGSVGYADFTYQILSGSTVVKSFSDYVYLTLSQNGFAPVVATVVTSTPPALRGFKLVTPAGSNQAVGYQWDATNVNVPLGVTLAPGQSSSLTFMATVDTGTWIQNTTSATEYCVVNDLCPQLLAYSGFGDPIGKGSGPGSNAIADPYFPILNLGLPTFDSATGVLGGGSVTGVQPSLPLPGVTPASPGTIPKSVLNAVPEPSDWILMLAGMGLVGLGLRRRSAVLRT